MPEQISPRRVLSIYLIKKGFTKPNEILVDAKSCDEYRIALPRAVEATLYVKETRPHPPSWTPFFEGKSTPALGRLKVASTAGILLVKRKTRILALSFGYGRHLLAPGAFEENFGLRVTLNTIDGGTLRTIDRDRLEAVARHTREQASRATDIAGFEINVEQDLLRAVTGVPKEPAFGDLLTGREALVATVRASLDDLPALLDRYLVASAGDEYRKTFPWADHIREVRDPTVKRALNEALVERVRRGELEGIWLTVPEVIDWNDLDGFRYGTGETGELQPDLHLKDYLAGVAPGVAITLESLKRDRVQAVASSSGKAAHVWRIFDCVYAELPAAGKVNLLNNGIWYQIEEHYANDVTKVVESIPAFGVALPAYRGPTEGHYNAAVAAAGGPDVALLDKKLIRYGGKRSAVEACDLYYRGGRFVHVKRYGSSSEALSHLFNQGVVGGNTFFRSPEFRREFDKLLPSDLKVTDPGAPINAANHEIAYAIIGRKVAAKTLPFFSKVTLRKAFEDLRGLGYGVSLAFIPDATQKNTGGRKTGAKRPRK